MKVVLTGAAGFLGWHTRLRLHAQGEHEVAVVARDNWADLAALVAAADAVVHIAGVNRGDDDEVRAGNLRLAGDVADAVRGAGQPVRVVYANSIQDGNGTPYGAGKGGAAETLKTLRGDGHTVVDVRLPNHLRGARTPSVQQLRRNLRARGGYVARRRRSSTAGSSCSMRRELRRH